MLKITELGPDIREVVLKGLIEKHDIETLERDLTPFIEADGQKGLVLRIEDWDDMTADALAEDAKFEFSLLPHAAKLAKVAVVTDKQLFEALFRWMDPVLPAMDLRTFGSADVEAARAWAADLPQKSAAAEGPGIRVVEDGQDGLLVFELDGRMSQEGVDAVFAAFDSATRTHGRIDLLARVTQYGGFDPAILADMNTLTSKLGAIGKVRRYAVVGAPGWMRGMVQAMGPMLPFEMNTFDASEEDAARRWLRTG